MKFTRFWVAWIGAFFAIEGTAIWARETGRHDGGTFSSLVWKLQDRGPFWKGVFAGFWVSISQHLLFRKP